jgi:hypothetical protein
LALGEFTPHIIFLLPSEALFWTKQSPPLCLNKSDSTINVRRNPLTVYSALSTSSASVDFLHVFFSLSPFSSSSLASYFLMVCKHIRQATLPVKRGGKKKINDIHKVNFFSIFPGMKARRGGDGGGTKSLALHLNVIYIQHIPAYSSSFSLHMPSNLIFLLLFVTTTIIYVSVQSSYIEP